MVVESVPDNVKPAVTAKVLPLVKSNVPVVVSIVKPSYVALEIAPVAEMSQSLELIAKVFPPSPRITAPPGVKVKSPVVVKVVEAPEKEISVSATVKSSNVLAPVKVCVPCKRAIVPVRAGKVIVKSEPGSSAVSWMSFPSAVVPSKNN